MINGVADSWIFFFSFFFFFRERSIPRQADLCSGALSDKKFRRHVSGSPNRRPRRGYANAGHYAKSSDATRYAKKVGRCEN